MVVWMMNTKTKKKANTKKKTESSKKKEILKTW